MAIACPTRSPRMSADGALKARGDVGGTPARQRAGRFGAMMRHGGLQAGEGEVAARAVQQRARQRDAGRAARAPGLQRRAARTGQAEQFRGLVERLADRVVERAAEQAVAPDAFHRDALAMAAGEEQEQIREAGLGGTGRAGGRSGRAPPDG